MSAKKKSAIRAWFQRAGAAIREFLRKRLVTLKRNPSIIPLIMLAATFILYSFNLTLMSDTTAKIQGAGMGLSQFCIMLFSILSMVCLLNAFPRRKKPNLFMLAVMFVMFAIIIYCDTHYTGKILAALNRPESPIVLDQKTVYIAKAFNMLNTHRILMIVNTVLVATVPLYGKLLKKINTSVTVEENQDMGAIELDKE